MKKIFNQTIFKQELCILVSKYTQKNAILNYFQPENTTSAVEEIALSILSSVFNDLVTDSSKMAFGIVNSFE